MLEFISQNHTRVNISLLDVNGRRVRAMFSGYLNKGENYHEFPVGDLQNGIYFLHMKTNTGYLINKIIINH